MLEEEITQKLQQVTEGVSQNSRRYDRADQTSFVAHDQGERKCKIAAGT